MERHCQFCLAGQSGGARLKWHDKPLYATDSFIVLPSIGAIVRGWLLVLPREHLISCSHIPPELRPEFAEIVNQTTTVASRAFGRPALFEHGGTTPGSQIACGIAHAHLHVVTLPFDLERTVISGALELEWSERNSAITDLPLQEQDYLALSGGGYRTLLASPRRPVSQFFRRVIATTLGCPDKYDYRVHYFLRNVASTRTQFLVQLGAVNEDVLGDHRYSVEEAAAVP